MVHILQMRKVRFREEKVTQVHTARRKWQKLDDELSDSGAEALRSDLFIKFVRRPQRTI